MTNKKPLAQLFKNINDKLDLGYNLVDYFITIGSNPSIFQNAWLYESDLNTLNTKYKENIKPIIINRFPLNDKKLIGFDEAIIQHCFPKGFEVHEFNKQPDYKIFSILLDNNNYSINYPYKYVVCLRFYESINNYKKLFDKYNNLKTINIPRDSDNNCDEDNIDEDIKGCKSENISFKELKKKIKFYNNGDIYCPEPLDGNFLDTDFSSSDTKINFGLNKTVWEKNDMSMVNNKFNNIDNNNKHIYKKYYIPKCICLISLYPFINELSKIIKIIYKYSLGEKQIHPLEKIINNLLIEVPTPPKGIYSIEYSLINETILLKATQRNDLHVLNIEFYKLFTIFNISNIMEIFRYLMLNMKIIIFSEEITNLTPVIMSLLSLLYPFNYPFQVVSVLHKEAYKLIDNIQGVLLGINEKYNKNFLAENDVDICDYTLIVNIDKQELIKLEPDDPHKMKKPLPELPSKYKISLENKISNCINEIKKNKKMKGKTNYFQESIRRYFLEFQIELMKDYSKYLNNDIYKHQDDGKKPIEKAFKLKEFLNKVPSEYYYFYESFLETQMFCDFLYKRMMPRDKIEQMDILFFEELLLKNKTDCILLNSQNYNFSKKYSVQKPTPLTLQQIYHFNHFDIRNKLLINGIEITNRSEYSRKMSFNFRTNISMNDHAYNNINNKNAVFDEINDAKTNSSNSNIKIGKNNINTKNQPLFTYIIFPKLDHEYFYNSDIKNYHIDYSMFQEIKNIDNELLSKSHLRRVEIKTSENENNNYILLIWLKLWVSTFNYQDKQEQIYRFFQMLNIIEKISQHEMGVINNLFDVLIKNQIDDDLILLLYQNILSYQLIPSNFIFRTVDTLINNKKKKLNVKTLNISKYVKSLNDKLNKYFSQALLEKKNFRKRTLKSKYDTQILDEKVSFIVEDNCSKCDKKNDMNQYMNKIKEGNDDLFWVKCPYCGNNYIPNLKIIFGSENNKNNKLTTTTAIVDNVLLFSAKTLNYNLIGTVLNNNTLNVEEFKSNFNPYFWNTIWYFKIKKLPFDFILPYERNIIYRSLHDKSKEKNNFENKKKQTLSKYFQLNFCDYVLKAKKEMEYKRKYWNNKDKLTISSHIIDIFIPQKNYINKSNSLKKTNTYSSYTTNYN